MTTEISRFIKRITCYGVTVFILLNALALLLDAHLRKSSIFKANIIYKGIPAEHITLGSSRSLTGVNTKMLKELTEKEWFNLSVDDTPIETHLLMLKLASFRNNPIRCMILQYDDSTNGRELHKINDRDYQFLPFAYEDNGILWNYLKTRGNGLGAALYIFPILKYAYYNTELFFPALNLLFNPDYSHRSDKFGDYFYPDNTKKNIECEEYGIKNIDLTNNTLDKIISHCSDNRISLIVFTAPYKCQKIQTRNTKNFVFLDYSDAIKNINYFIDDLHLNRLGRDTFTQMMALDINKYCH
jgi:hypothetical protein